MENVLSVGDDFINKPKDRVDNRRHCVEEQEHKIFPILEANAVVNPGAMMIHVEHASVTDRAVMASFRLEHVTDQTVPFALHIIIT